MLVWLVTSSTIALTFPLSISRRDVGLAAGACTFGAALPAKADSSTAIVTDKVRLEFVQQLSAEDSASLPLTIGASATSS